MIEVKRRKTSMEYENEDLDQELKCLMAEACSAPKESSQRNRRLTRGLNCYRNHINIFVITS